MSGEGDPAVREAELRSYHLGTLSAERQEEIDDHFLADDALHAELQAAADDLIHAYLAGQLSAGERARFEGHFLLSRRHRDRFAFVRTLVTAVGRAGNERAAGAAPPPARASRWTTWLPWAAALVVGLAAGGWSIGEKRRIERERDAARDRVSRLEHTLAEQSGHVEEPPSGRQASKDVGQVATWTVRPGLQRGSTTDPFELRSEWVLLRIPLADQLRAPSYRLSLQTSGGNEIQRSRSLPTASGTHGRTVDMMVRASLLPPASYMVLILSDDAEAQEIDAAPFVVRRD